jgi:hypothetical protein
MSFFEKIKIVLDRVDSIVAKLEDCAIHLENAAHSIDSASKGNVSFGI